MSDYITIAGIVQFEPRHRTVKDKAIRDIAVRSIADQRIYNVTLWPEKENIKVNKGDFVVVDGKYAASAGQNKDGEQVTWHNLSANTFHNLATMSTEDAPVATKNAPASTGDDFPF